MHGTCSIAQGDAMSHAAIDYSRYQTLRYTIRRAITGDFDF